MVRAAIAPSFARCRSFWRPQSSYRLTRPLVPRKRYFMMLRILAAVSLVLALWGAARPAAGELPDTLAYQGYLTDSAGAPVSQTVSVEFALFGAANGGTALWSETQNVAVDNGLFSVALGVVEPLPEDISAGPLYLGIAVNGDAPMQPRRALRSAPFALRSAQADTVQGATLDDIVALASDGAVPLGAAIAVSAAQFDDQSFDTSTASITLDGRSFDITYDQFGVSRWEPLTLVVEYALGQASPLAITSGQLLFNTVSLALVDGPSSVVTLRGTQVVAGTATVDIVPSMAGGHTVRERLLLSGAFTFTEATAPIFDGPLQVNIDGDANDVFAAAAPGTWAASVPTGPGPGGQPLYSVTIEGFGPREFATLDTTLSFTTPFRLTLALDGVALPGARDCTLARIAGLSPATFDENGSAVPSLRFGHARFDCQNPLDTMVR